MGSEIYHSIDTSLERETVQDSFNLLSFQMPAVDFVEIISSQLQVFPNFRQSFVLILRHSDLILCLNSSILETVVACTFALMCHQKKNSQGFKSEERAGQLTGPCLQSYNCRSSYPSTLVL